MRDYENEINEYLVNTSNYLSKYPNQIYQALILYNRMGYLRSPSIESLLTIEIQQHNSTIAGRSFLPRSRAGKIDGKFQYFLMGSQDEGISILLMGSEKFIDATFRWTPHSFVQGLTVMSFDPSTNLFVPCIWELMSRKNEYLHCDLLYAIIVQLKFMWLSILRKRL
ncbi:hypothetical protein HZS_3823 [Henneguya salminicola]|nr:hypothetical protein HZS_3823 [Henneguya salminicola]